ncbi:hypothetical protein Aperf_G00000075954 [Anoplocephala perfoliata]
MQVIVRFFLGLIFFHATVTLGSVFKEKLDPEFGVRFLLIAFTQFHLAYYCTRALPNTFALITVTYALVFLLKGSDHHFIILSGFGILVFRSELMLLYGPLLIFGLYFKLVRIRPMLLVTGIVTVVVSLCLTVTIDSFFWQRWVWPEGEVFYFNVIKNKSHLWGTKPFYWYFVIALPKALMTTLGLILCSNLVILFSSSSSDPVSRERRVFLGLELSALAFITIYSFLPHKELRFIFYTLHIFNLLAAERRLRMCLDERTARELASKQKSGKSRKATSQTVRWICRLAVFLCYASLITNFCISLGLVYVSYHNYPGGQAISRLNNWSGLSSRKDVHVYISNLAAQTGVSRFQEVHANWIYNKTEAIDDDVKALINGPFTHFILEVSKDHLAEYPMEFRRLFTVKSFSGLAFNPREVLWKKLKVSMNPAL